MDTKPFRIFLLGTTLAVGAVIGLAPVSDARPLVEVNPSGPVIEVPPTTVKPPKGIDPCLVRVCDDPPVLIEGCLVFPELCEPPKDTPPDDTPPAKPPLKNPENPKSEGPHPRPKTPRPSTNPDVVVQTPRFTG